jgi:hypothetical protein
MKQVEEEYYKTDEKNAQIPTGQAQSTLITAKSELYPPSPDQPINSMMQNIPEPVKEAVNSLIRGHKTIIPLQDPENVVVIPEIEVKQEIPLFKDSLITTNETL